MSIAEPMQNAFLMGFGGQLKLWRRLAWPLVLFGFMIAPMVVQAEGGADLEQVVSPEPAMDTGATEPISEYILGPGDRLRVTVFGQQDLSGEFSVSGNGTIALPLIGEVASRDVTVDELSQRIARKLKPDYLVNPRISVEVLNFRPFFIIGEVKNPGSYSYQHGMTVVNAVALAGGYTYRARRGRVLIKRAKGDVRTEKRANEGTYVLPGDVIRVPERFF